MRIWPTLSQDVIALVITVAAAAGLILYSHEGGWVTVQTDVGAYHRETLSDGSRIHLNTATRLRYRFSGDLRVLSLDEGEARFSVAHDVSRPFVVLAGNTAVRAVGTEFSVRKRADDWVEVMVVQGVVAFTHVPEQSRVYPFLKGRPIPVKGGKPVPAGSLISYRGGMIFVMARSPSEMEDHDSWREDKLTFTGVSLPDAIAEINRYNRYQLEIADPRLATMKLGGILKPRDLNEVLLILNRVLGIRASRPEKRADGTTVIRLFGPEARDNKKK